MLSEATDGLPIKATGSATPGLATLGTGPVLLAKSQVVGSVAGSGVRLSVSALNEPAVAGSGVTVYTSMWGSSVRPSAPVGILVVNGKVVRREVPAARGTIPSNGYLLEAVGSAAARLESLRVGNPFAVSYHLVVASFPEAHRVTVGSNWTGVGGAGARLVQGGELGHVSGFCSARNETPRPRAALGIFTNGDAMVVAFSGTGATVHQEAVYLRELGVSDAVNLDGGTSVTLLVRRSMRGPLVRVDASGAQRHIPNVLAFETP